MITLDVKGCLENYHHYVTSVKEKFRSATGLITFLLWLVVYIVHSEFLMWKFHYVYHFCNPKKPSNFIHVHVYIFTYVRCVKLNFQVPPTMAWGSDVASLEPCPSTPQPCPGQASSLLTYALSTPCSEPGSCLVLVTALSTGHRPCSTGFCSRTVVPSRVAGPGRCSTAAMPSAAPSAPQPQCWAGKPCSGGCGLGIFRFLATFSVHHKTKSFTILRSLKSRVINSKLISLLSYTKSGLLTKRGERERVRLNYSQWLDNNFWLQQTNKQTKNWITACAVHLQLIHCNNQLYFNGKKSDLKIIH